MRTILVADDETAIPYAAFLMKRGATKVYEAADGIEALDLWREHRDAIDLVVLDVRMPGLSGPEVYDAIVDERGTPAFLFVSGHDLESMPFEDLRPVAYWVKGRGMEDFLEAVDEALRGRGSP